MGGVVHLLLYVLFSSAISLTVSLLMRQRIPRHASAIHEAGHAIAVVVRGLKLKSVNITRTVNRTANRNRSRTGLCSFERTTAIGAIIILYAGPYAQAKAYPKFMWTGANGDFTNAEEDLDKLWSLIQQREFHPKWLTKDNVREFCRLEARYLVDEHWHSIVKVAGELLVKEVLSGEEVKSLLPCALSTPRGFRELGP